MRVRLVALGLLMLGLAPAVFADDAPWQAKIHPRLAAALAKAPAAKTEFLVVLADQADLSAARRIEGKRAKGDFVFRTLTAKAEATQAPIRALLAARGVESQSFWVANFLWVKGDAALADTLAERADVARLEPNPRVRMTPPLLESGPGAPPARTPAAIEWNITKVNADDLWTLGFTGQGAVVGGQDTGYQWDHPAIKGKYRGWNGSTADHNYNWHDSIHTAPGNPCGANVTAPCDDHGHGTHTMGTMVGDDGAGNQVGMAPGAKWIGCRNMDEGNGTPATYSECFQWFIAPTDLAGANPDPTKSPDVINNSWGCPASEGCSALTLQTVVENTRAAGIFVAVSAGNSGSSCSTVEDPAAIYDASFSVASTTSSDDISSFSSRGPVTADGSNRRKPDIAAPGSSVRSSYPTNTYATLSGTSMAGPHVAGLVALLVSVRPTLAGEVDALEEILRESAAHVTCSFGGCQTCGAIAVTSWPNNTFGFGRIDALAAKNWIDAGNIFKDGFETGIVDGWSGSGN
ncbi:MAG: S8 family serine peptidase [Thermoanaerobaculia bacterium]